MSALKTHPRRPTTMEKQACPVISIQGALTQGVMAELEDLLKRALRGELVGIGVVTIDQANKIEVSSAGSLGRKDGLRAAGAFHYAAQAVLDNV